MQAPHQKTDLSPDVLFEALFSLAPSRALSAGVQLQVFSYIAAGNKTAAEIARAAGTSERGMRMLLDALVAIELLTKQNGYYQLTPLTARFLVRGHPDYVGGFMEDDGFFSSLWFHLAEAVRTGEPVERAEEAERAQQFFPFLLRCLHFMHLEPARKLARILTTGTSARGLQVLDVAAGSAVWSIAIAEADPDCRITAQDFPGVLDTARQYVQRHGVEGRYDFLPGDLNDVDLGIERFDLAILGHIVHLVGERESRELFRRVHRALTAGGRIAIPDILPNPDRTGPPFPVLFSLLMLLRTKEGGTYTLPEFTAWLKEAGFRRVETAAVETYHSPVIIAWKD